MKQKCIDAVNAHLSNVHGKPVKMTPAQIARIDSRMHEGAKVLARRDPARWRNWSADERTVAIGKWVREQEQIAADATARSQQRQLAAIARQAARLEEFANARPDKPGKWGNAVIDMLEGVDNTVRGAELVALRDFGELADAAKKGTAFDFGSRQSDAFYADATREIYGIDTGNVEAKAFAAKWSARMDGYREARNRAGDTVGKLEHYAPQSHTTTIMQRDDGTAWKSFLMQNLDRSLYLDDTGKALGDTALEKVIDKMYTTLVTDGASKITTDAQGLAEAFTGRGTSNYAKRLNDSHREIHFKDAEAVINYNKQFSDRSLGASFFEHMVRQARDVAVINELGPNPEGTYAKLRDTARTRDSAMPGAKFHDKSGQVVGSGRGLMDSDAYFRQMLGHNEFTTFDQVSAALTAYQAATKLTSTALRAPFQDTPGMLLNMADVGQLGKIGTILHTAFNPKEAARFGIGAEVALQTAKYASRRILHVGRWQGIGNAMNRYAQATMKYTLLDAWTNAARRAGQTSHALALGEWSSKSWAQLDDSQRGILHNAGIQEADWSHIMQLPRRQLRGNDIHDVSDVQTLGLDADSAAALQSKMMGFIRMGGDIVTSEHNLTAQTLMSLGGRANFITKQTMLFKNAGAVQTAHLMDRLSRKSTDGKVKYLAATMAINLGFGYLALAAQAATQGQRPPPLNDWRTVARALSVAGGFAFFQDMVTSAYNASTGNASGYSSSAIPVFGDLETISKATLKAANGETGEAGYIVLRFARQQAAPLNYWYAKAAIDHLFFNDAAEALNPGYTKRLRKYADQQGQQHFWDPLGSVTDISGRGRPLLTGRGSEGAVGRYKTKDDMTIIGD